MDTKSGAGWRLFQRGYLTRKETYLTAHTRHGRIRGLYSATNFALHTCLPALPVIVTTVVSLGRATQLSLSGVNPVRRDPHARIPML